MSIDYRFLKLKINEALADDRTSSNFLVHTYYYKT